MSTLTMRVSIRSHNLLGMNQSNHKTQILWSSGLISFHLLELLILVAKLKSKVHSDDFLGERNKPSEKENSIEDGKYYGKRERKRKYSVETVPKYLGKKSCFHLRPCTKASLDGNSSYKSTKIFVLPSFRVSSSVSQSQ